jgi:hypothetical protein
VLILTARELDEPVTKEFVRAELAKFRAELRQEFGAEFSERPHRDLRAPRRDAPTRQSHHRLMSAVTIAAMGIAVTLARLA